MRKIMNRFVYASIAAVCLVPLLLDAAPASPIAAAAERGDKDAVRALLKQAADVNGSQGDGMTALHWAATHGDAELAAMLVYAGANVRATTRLGGYTALHLASQAGSASVIKTLVAAGANVNAPTSTGATPLMLAATSGSADAVTRAARTLCRRQRQGRRQRSDRADVRRRAGPCGGRARAAPARRRCQRSRRTSSIRRR